MDSFKTFTASAKSLAKNPLGIIALFIVLIYGFASLVLTFGSSSLESPAERLPIIWFLALFPVAVLGVFGWLVAFYHKNLYGPSDYSEDESFLKTVGLGAPPPDDIEKDKADIATSDSDTETPPDDAETLLEEAYTEIVNADYCLLHAVEVIQERTAPRSGRYRIRVWIEEIVSRSLSDIESVTYRVWEDFKQKTFTSRSKESSFDLWMNVYGEFPILALVKFKDGSSIILQRYLDIPGRPPD